MRPHFFAGVPSDAAFAYIDPFFLTPYACAPARMGCAFSARHLPASWTSCQFPSPFPKVNLSMSRPKGGNMNNFNSWPELNWYAVGSLLAQFAFLAAGIWFARNFLRTIRAFQEQLGALLKLSITGVPPDRLAASTSTRRSFVDMDHYWLGPSGTQPAAEPESISRRPRLLAGVWRGLLCWLNAPMHSPELAAWRRLIHWLQAPAGSRAT